MLWKCCTQYASNVGKLSSDHRTGRGQFSFLSQRNAISNNVQTYHTISLISHTSKEMLKILQRQKNQRSNCQHSLDHQKSKSVPEKNICLFYWLCQRLWLCGSQQTVKIIHEIEMPDQLTCFLRNMYAGHEAIVRTGHGTTDWFQIGKGVHQSCILSPC